jgi:hypothetical protein
MQAKPTIVKIFLVALIASLVLGACGGGTTGKTWFNLPSIPITIGSDGSASVLGFNMGAIFPPALAQPLQAASVQKLEVRIGYNGILIYANGESLPYISWDADSVATLQEVLPKIPGIPGAMIASWLPMLRQIGLGVAISLPGGGAGGPRWSGETKAAEEPAPEKPTLGPFTLKSIAFDQSGNLNIGSVSAAALGAGGPLLDANTLGLLSSLGLSSLQIKSESNGIKLMLNDKPLPSIAYDSKSLERAKPLVGAFAPDMAPLLDNLLPKLQGAALDVAVSFTGQPIAETKLGTLPVAMTPEGGLSIYGIPLPGVTLPADLLQKLQQAQVQTLNVDVGQEGLFLAANGQTLPTITWTPESLSTLASIVAPLAGVSPGLVSNGLKLIQETGGIKAAVSLDGSSEAPAEINKTLGEANTTGAPILRLNANVEQGAIQSVEGVGNLSELGIGPVMLPPNVMQILSQLGAKQVQINTDPGHVNILLDGNTALTLNWDLASLQTALTLAGPFLAGSPLEDPNVAKLVQEQILPLVPGADVDVTLNLN